MNPLSVFEIEEWICDEEIEDIVLSPQGKSFFKRGVWTLPQKHEARQTRQLFQTAQTLAENSGQVLSFVQPTCDSILQLENSQSFRVHLAIAPLVLEGPQLTLRRLARAKTYNLESYCEDQKLCDKIRENFHGGASILVSGATGSGKSSFMSSLLCELSETTRVLILEDSSELDLPNPLSVKLLTRHDRFGMREGIQWDLSHLVFESLRMRPDRIVLGECRGPEAYAIAQAMQTGHQGIMTSLHAGSCLEAIERFKGLASETKSSAFLPEWDLVLHLSNSPAGRRVQELRVDGASYEL